MKKRISCLLMCVLTAVGSVPAYALSQESNVTFTVGGMKLAGDMTAVNIDGKNYLPMRAIFEMLGGEVDWNSDSSTAKADIDTMRVIINADDMMATVNGEDTDLDIRRINGSIYLPVRLLGETLGFRVNWDPETRNIDIMRADSDYVLLDTNIGVDEDTRVLTFEEAKALAEKKNSNIKNIQDSIDYMKEARDTLGRTMVAVDAAYGTISAMLIDTVQQADTALAVEMQLQTNIETGVELARNMKNIDIQTSLTKVIEQMIKDGLEIALVSQITAIKGSEIQMQLLEQSIAIGAEGVENTRLKNELGYASDVELKKAELAQEELEKNRDLLEESIKNQKEALNMSLGLPASEKIYIVYDAQVKDYSDFNLEKFIAKQKLTAPSIKVLQGNVDIAEYAMRTNPALINESKKSVRNSLNTAARALDDGKESLEKNIRSTYHNIQQLALKDKQLKLDVEQAVTDYNSAVVSYNAGLATAFTVKQARLGVLNAEKALEDNKLSYIMLTATFDKPYLLGASK